MAQRIFLIFCVKLGDYKSRKVTARFLKKILDLEIFPKRSPNYCRLVGWLVGNAVFSETARRIFLIFCMKLGDYKGRKVTEPDFWKKFLIWRYSRKGLQISPKSDTLIFFSKTALTIFLVFGLKLVLNMTFNLNEPIFQKNLQFGDIWPRNRQKIAQIEVFGHFLNFASLVFLDFAHNNRWAWCLVVFLQFVSPVNLFLF